MKDAEGRPIEVLMVDDNPGDVLLARQALLDRGLACQLHSASDSDSALAFLRRQGPYTSAPRPDLILLDLNLPGKHGSEALVEIKSDPELRSIPVIVLSSSRAEEDVRRSYQLHANCFVSKPVDFAQLCRLFGSLEEFWFGVATLPNGR